MRLAPRSAPPDRQVARPVALAVMPSSDPVSSASFSPGALAALRAAVAGCAAVDHHQWATISAELPVAARLLADAARAADPVRGEQLVIALKRAWPVLPEVQHLPTGGPREAVWNRLVTLCVEAFYAAPAPAALLSEPNPDRAPQR